jgi:Ricin-type beta-trefoil lectin domain-like
MRSSVKRCAVALAVALALPLGGSATAAVPGPTSVDQAALAEGEPDLTSANRTGSPSGLPDWSDAGYLGGQPLPTDDEITGNTACRITPDQLRTDFRVVPDDNVDDTTGLQNAIDRIKADCSPNANFYQLSLITLPAGRIDLSRQIYVDASFLVLRGQGSGQGGTKLVFRPDVNTRYDTVTSDGSRWNQDVMTWGSGSDMGKGGWIWPGRAMFKVQTREVAARYADEWASAPANRKDLFEGSVNQHWVSGVKLAAKDGDTGFSARQGDNTIRLAAKANMSNLAVGGYVLVGAANSLKFYESQGIDVDANATALENLHMRQQVFRVVRSDPTAKTISLDRPLEFDLPVDSTSDGSATIFHNDADPFPSKVTPLKMVEGVGFENFAFTQDMNGLPKLSGGTYSLSPNAAVHNYGNMAPEYAMNGLEFKWAANSWARGLNISMTGSHPIVTEVARNLQIEHNSFDGAWNKGKGGNGYLRGSRVWDSLYAYNTSRNLRHFTFQWSASGNVVYRNDLDSDLNLHGGWERYNLFEDNTVRIPYEHRSASCQANCGGEGGEVDEGTWYPIWWAAGNKAVKWSGSSGPQNVFYHNTLIKQTTAGGPFLSYQPYSVDSPGVEADTVYEFGSDSANPRRFTPLRQSGATIPDWTSRETLDYLGQGVVTRTGSRLSSLFLRDVGQPEPRQNGTRRVASWNMQGAGTGNGTYTSKYNRLVGLVGRNRLSVIALQEAGAVSRRVRQMRVGGQPQTVYTNPATGDHPDVEEFIFSGTLADPRLYLYWMHTDTNSTTPGRVNLAMVTRARADHIFVVPSVFPDGRPSFGVRIANTVYWTIHASASGGGDGPTLVQRIRTLMAANGLDWIALGDFNRDPGLVQTNLGNQYVAEQPGGPTHPVVGAGGPINILDYLVRPTGAGVPLVDPSSPRVLTHVMDSDHHPVEYQLTNLRGEAEPQDLPADPDPPRTALLRNAGTTNVADRDRAGGNLIRDVPYRQGNDQRWTLLPDIAFPGYYTIRNAATGQYMGQQGSTRDAPVVQWPTWAPDQLWRPDYQGDGTWTLTNMVTDQLLTSLSDGGQLVARDDDGSAGQRWFFETDDQLQDVRALAHIPPGPDGDLMADLDHGSSADGTPAVLRKDDNVASQRFSVIPAVRSAGKNCYYLANSGKYLNTSSSGDSPVDGTTVTLNPFHPNADSYLWCTDQGSLPMTLSNRSVARGFREDLYLTDHGVDNPLTVENDNGTVIQPWQWRTAT